MGRGAILVVDDSPLTIEALRRGLEADGFTVRAAIDLAEIPRPLRDAGIDLVLIDVEMAEAFGDDVAVVLRDDEGRGPPIYLLSALEDAELAERARTAGVDGFIRKRDGVGEVVRRVAEILGGPRHTALEELRAGMSSLFIDVARRRANHARVAVATGGRDELRHAAYELHALVGEAAVLGFAELAELAQDGRRMVARCLEHADASTLRPCEDLLLRIERDIDAIAPTSPAAPPRSARGTGPTTAGRRILLVDDSDIFRVTLRAVLEDGGFEVSEATTVAECRSMLDGARADLVVLDVELSDGSGLDLIPAVRAALPASRVVVLSGGDHLTVTDQADLVLLKTLDPTSVLVKLERLLADRA